jgi:hypothetical protein
MWSGKSALFSGSNNGENWIPLAGLGLPQEVGDDWLTFVLGNNVPFRYYRLVVVEQRFCSLAEIELCGEVGLAKEVGPMHKPKTILCGDLTIETSGTDAGFIECPDEAINDEVGTAAEVKLKVLSAPKEQDQHDGAIFVIQDGKTEGKLAFFMDRVEFFDTNNPLGYYPINTTNKFHTYKLTLLCNTFTVYIDGKKVFSAKLASEMPRKKIMFGDFSSRTGENFHIQVKYLVYSTEGVLATAN